MRTAATWLRSALRVVQAAARSGFGGRTVRLLTHNCIERPSVASLRTATLIRRWIGKVIPGHPQGAGIAEEPQRKQHAERAERPQQHTLGDVCEHHERQGRRRDDDGRHAVVEVDRADEVARLALVVQPADGNSLGMVNQPENNFPWPQRGQRSRSVLPRRLQRLIV